MNVTKRIIYPLLCVVVGISANTCHAQCPATSGSKITGYIYTFAGGTEASVTATLAKPKSVASDKYGNVYVADSGNNVIWECNVSSSTFSVVAGINGVAGNTNGALGVNTLDDPEGVAVDGAGNIYISDTGNNEVRVVNSTGTMSTLVSSGLDHPEGIVVDSSTGTATYGYLADADNNTVWQITLSTGALTRFAGSGSTGCIDDGSPATSGCLYEPLDVALDASGNLYIADSGHCLVREVSSGSISTFAGTANTCGTYGGGGSPTSAEIYVLGVTVDPYGSVYIGSGTEVWKVQSSTITSVAGTGSPGYTGDGQLATSSSVTLAESDKQGMVFDPNGTLYISDEDNNAVRDIFWLAPPACGSITYTPSTYKCGLYGVTNPSGPLSSSGGLAELYSAKSGTLGPREAGCVWSGFPVCATTSDKTLTIDTVDLNLNNIDPYQGSSDVLVKYGSTLLADWAYNLGSGPPFTVSIPSGTILGGLSVSGTAIACDYTGCTAETEVGYIHIN